MKKMMMISVAFAFAASAVFATPEGWTDDFDAAKAQAAKEKKLMLVDFSGSDWCGWCMRLDEEVFSKKAFIDEAAKDFVLVLIDSPRDKSKLSEKAKEQNPKLVKEYGIRGYPTVLILDAGGKRLRKTGYRKGGPKAYLEELAKLKKSIEAGEDPEKEEREKRAAREAIVKKYWTDDFAAAKARAAKEKKLMLVDFSGSDWCGWCMRLDEEVFSKKAFIDEAAKDFVLVLIDSPRDKSKLSEKAKEQNPKLVKEYGVRGYPTVLILDAEGNKLTETGYRRGGPEKYLKHLAEKKVAMVEFKAFKESVKTLEKGSAERIAKIDEFLQKIGEEEVENHEGLVNELLEHDKDGKFAAKYPHFAYYKPAAAKFEEFCDRIENEFKNRLKALGYEIDGDMEKVKKEDREKLEKDFAVLILGKIPEVKKAIEDIKASAPESIRGKIDKGILGRIKMIEEGYSRVGKGKDAGDKK